jgi:hypothetical protein
MAKVSSLTNAVILTLLMVAAAITWVTHPRVAVVSLMLALGHITLMVVRRVRA